MERRLVAILAADVVGYSRLMGADEAGTLARLKALRRELVQPRIKEHGGRIVKLMGDGLLADFASVVEAVRCAALIQEETASREPGLPDESRIRLRIGINLGDIIVEGRDIYGDGVNVAARLEGLAEPGGICVSGPVLDAIDGKLDLSFEDIGARQVKNIARPVRAYRWAPDTESQATRVRSGERPNAPAKPSIAVLPFSNMSGDPEQEYFSDGITEDIITELSRFKNLFVIARNSTFAFKGRAVDAGEVGARLGVAYLVEGSVRRAGRRVRVTAQLVETETGNHLWAERYDRELEDVFAVQDELVHEIVAAIPGQLDAVAVQRARRRPAESQTAYDCVLRGEWHLRQDFGSAEARAMFEKAIEIDPQCARAFTRLAGLHAYSVFLSGTATDEARRLAQTLAEQALELDPTDPAVQATGSVAYIMLGEHDRASSHIERAIRLNPNDFVVMRSAGIVLAYLGERDEGLAWFRRLSHHDPFSGELRELYFDIAYMDRRYADAIEVFRGWRDPPPHMYAEYASACAQQNEMDEARAAIAKLEEARPAGFEIAEVIRVHARMCARPEDREHWLEGYRKAGLL